MLWAQVDPVSGWIQVILQGGAFALLTYIVVKQFPWWFQEARIERKECGEERQKAMQAFQSVIAELQAENKQDRELMSAEHREVILRLQAEFAERNRLLAASIKDQTKELATEFHAQSEAVFKILAKMEGDK